MINIETTSRNMLLSEIIAKSRGKNYLFLRLNGREICLLGNAVQLMTVERTRMVGLYEKQKVSIVKQHMAYQMGRVPNHYTNTLRQYRVELLHEPIVNKRYEVYSVC